VPASFLQETPAPNGSTRKKAVSVAFCFKNENIEQRKHRTASLPAGYKPPFAREGGLVSHAA
jgi:hypothetical protein